MGKDNGHVSYFMATEQQFPIELWKVKHVIRKRKMSMLV